MKQKVYVFGNPDYAPDALPLKILPALKKQLPDFDFIVQDPNEDWVMPEKLIIIDTVQGIKDVTVFRDLDKFVNTPSLTCHDFDLGMKLKWLKKLGQLPPLQIIGIPMNTGKYKESIAGQLIDLLNK